MIGNRIDNVVVFDIKIPFHYNRGDFSVRQIAIVEIFIVKLEIFYIIVQAFFRHASIHIVEKCRNFRFLLVSTVLSCKFYRGFSHAFRMKFSFFRIISFDIFFNLFDRVHVLQYTFPLFPG